MSRAARVVISESEYFTKAASELRDVRSAISDLRSEICNSSNISSSVNSGPVKGKEQRGKGKGVRAKSEGPRAKREASLAAGPNLAALPSSPFALTPLPLALCPSPFALRPLLLAQIGRAHV